jgi:predicted nucleotidyltransferase component of viral defense system
MMPVEPYPRSLAGLDSWRKQAGVTADEARKRLVQFVALESIAADRSLVPLLSFKGGNALRLVYGSPRSTADLDFTADAALPDEEVAIRTALDRAFLQGGRRFGIKIKCQRVNRKPANKQATLPTYDVAVGYQLPGDRYYADFDAAHRQVPTVVKVEISFNDLVCETQRLQLAPDLSAQLQVCTLEDILAEKLRALLQQVIRNRTRPQDAFDIARMVRDNEANLDLGKIATFLVEKCKARGIAVSRAAFADSEVKSRASYEYLHFARFSPTWSRAFSRDFEGWRPSGQVCCTRQKGHYYLGPLVFPAIFAARV